MDHCMLAEVKGKKFKMCLIKASFGVNFCFTGSQSDNRVGK